VVVVLRIALRQEAVQSCLHAQHFQLCTVQYFISVDSRIRNPGRHIAPLESRNGLVSTQAQHNEKYEFWATLAKRTLTSVNQLENCRFDTQRD